MDFQYVYILKVHKNVRLVTGARVQWVGCMPCMLPTSVQSPVPIWSPEPSWSGP